MTSGSRPLPPPGGGKSPAVRPADGDEANSPHPDASHSLGIDPPPPAEGRSCVERANREGGIRSAESNKYPPPHPSPSRGDGGECRSPRAEREGSVLGGRGEGESENSPNSGR